MRKLCIVGGMGPLATSDCYTRIIEKSPATKDQEHIETLIISDCLMPDRTKSIISGDSKELLEHFKNNFKIAEVWGADFIIIPCNTSHFYYDKFVKMTDIKILNMIHLAAKKASDRTYVFATEGTYKSKIYKKYLEQENKEYLPLTDEEKRISNDTIYRIKQGEEPKLQNFPEFRKMLEEKSEKAGVILACTELSLLDIKNDNVIDAMNVLVDETVKEAYA